MIEAASLAQKSSDTPEHLIIVQGHELLGNESPVDSLVTADSLAPAGQKPQVMVVWSKPSRSPCCVLLALS